jgi:dolichol-phosphate mannosyltransferase
MEDIKNREMTGVYIVIPTYQEIDGIETIIDSIFSVDQDFHLIIVDDNSPDGTANFVRSLCNDNISVVVRSGKLGIGSAIIEGFRQALSFSDCRVVVTMDADMSHDPLSIPFLVDKLTDCDLVQGSRFVAGGRDVGRAWHRRLISRMANFLYRVIFSLDQREITTSFRAYSRKSAEILIANTKTKKYEFALESALILQDHNLKVEECPIIFVDRRKGKSKLDIKELTSSLFFLINTILFRFKRIFKFCIVGLTGIIVNQGSLWLLTESIFPSIHLYYLNASMIAIELSILSNFVLNNFFTFGDAKKEWIIVRLLKYNLTCIIGSIFNFIVLWSFTEWFHIHYLISNLLGIVVAFLWNYSISFRWVWKKNDKASG